MASKGSFRHAVGLPVAVVNSRWLTHGATGVIVIVRNTSGGPLTVTINDDAGWTLNAGGTALSQLATAVLAAGVTQSFQLAYVPSVTNVVMSAQSGVLVIADFGP